MRQLPTLELKAFWQDECLVDMKLEEKRISSEQMVDRLPDMRRAVEMLFDWIEVASEIRKQKANSKAATFVNEEKFSSRLDEIEARRSK